MRSPNLLYIFADQWRASAVGYAGNTVVRTPNIDRFSAEAVSVPNALSTCPCCSPYRASLLTGRFPLSHGVFVNDVQLDPSLPSIGTTFRDAGFTTAYIGKWHVHAGGRSTRVPSEHRMGFEYWKAMECSHSYLNSQYFANQEIMPRTWRGYDAFAQTEDLIEYIETVRTEDRPFAALLSWGPPHAPPPYEAHSDYDQYPSEFADSYDPCELHLRPNVPEREKRTARRLLAGYYTHCSALDTAFGRILDYLRRTKLLESTIVVFTSDHGDLLGSHGLYKKQTPFAEAIDVPFLIHIPGVDAAVRPDVLLEPEDMLPTLASLAGIEAPESCEGRDLSDPLRYGTPGVCGDSVIACYVPNGQWRMGRDGGTNGFTGREYRGLRTLRYTYVRDRSAPWLLFDNQDDPYQRRNLIADPAHAAVCDALEAQLQARLAERADRFETARGLLDRFGYDYDEDLTVPFEA